MGAVVCKCGDLRGPRGGWSSGWLFTTTSLKDLPSRRSVFHNEFLAFLIGKPFCGTEKGNSDPMLLSTSAATEEPVEEISTESLRPANEHTPLNGQEEVRQGPSTQVILTLLFVGLVLGLLPAIVNLTIYYTNDGDHAHCGSPLPLWLWWGGTISAVNTLLPLATLPLICCVPDRVRLPIQGYLTCLGAPLNTVLFVWFIIGCIWVFSTDETHCDAVLYNQSKLYIIVSFCLIPVFICCGVCAMFCFMMAVVVGAEQEKQMKASGT